MPVGKEPDKVLALKPDGYLLKSTDKATLLKSLEDFFEKRNTSSCSLIHIALLANRVGR